MRQIDYRVRMELVLCSTVVLHADVIPDCGRHRECCYEHDDTFNIVQSEGLECSTIDSNVFVRSRSLKLYMVTSCPNGTKCLNTEPIVPATSEREKRVYINKECAECNTDTDITVWDVGYTCRKIKYIPTLEESADESCFRFVQPPSSGDYNWAKHFICSDVVNTCKSSNDNEDLVRPCQDIVAPAIPNNRLVANPFCAACNYDPVESRGHLCQLFSADTSRVPGFGILLDTTTIDQHNIMLKKVVTIKCHKNTIQNPNAVSVNISHNHML